MTGGTPERIRNAAADKIPGPLSLTGRGGSTIPYTMPSLPAREQA
jgi:hypothetical protein